MNGVNETIHYKKPSLEHIFPQNAKEKEWSISKYSDDDIANNLNQIGNLILFDQSKNSSLGNKSFDKRKNIIINQNPH
jgi:protein tyrosine/serine phosphatase